MTIMKHPAPLRPELGASDGLSYALFLPDEAPTIGVVICHGAGSAKESHFDYARAARELGMAALAYDARGHGRSEGALDAATWDDALAMGELLRERSGAAELALRGSSMGGFTAIGAAARSDGDVAAVAAICPAPEDLLLRGLRSGRFDGFRADHEAIEPWLESVSLYDAAASLAPRTALLLMHARGDEQVPYTISEELFAAAGEPKRLLLLPGGHHRSLQHDMEIQAASLRFIAAAVRERRGGGQT
jgi:alpha-beta hydrolase superfamily lysophospholipase